MMNTLIGLLLSFVAVFLILLVLVQRGRGGGLAGALGGMGGQSAFGAKAGDVFTRITIVTAIVWIVLTVIAVKYLGTEEKRINLGGPKTTTATQSGFQIPAGSDDASSGALSGAGSDVAPKSTDDEPADSDQ